MANFRDATLIILITVGLKRNALQREITILFLKPAPNDIDHNIIINHNMIMSENYVK